MTSITDNDSAASGARRLASRTGRRLLGGWAAYRRRVQIARDIRHLRQLSDHHLDDIGVKRSDIEYRVQRPNRLWWV